MRNIELIKIMPFDKACKFFEDILACTDGKSDCENCSLRKNKRPCCPHNYPDVKSWLESEALSNSEIKNQSDT